MDERPAPNALFFDAQSGAKAESDPVFTPYSLEGLFALPLSLRNFFLIQLESSGQAESYIATLHSNLCPKERERKEHESFMWWLNLLMQRYFQTLFHVAFTLEILSQAVDQALDNVEKRIEFLEKNNSAFDTKRALHNAKKEQKALRDFKEQELQRYKDRINDNDTPPTEKELQTMHKNLLHRINALPSLKRAFQSTMSGGTHIAKNVSQKLKNRFGDSFNFKNINNLSPTTPLAPLASTSFTSAAYDWGDDGQPTYGYEPDDNWNSTIALKNHNALASKPDAESEVA